MVSTLLFSLRPNRPTRAANQKSESSPVAQSQAGRRRHAQRSGGPLKPRLAPEPPGGVDEGGEQPRLPGAVDQTLGVPLDGEDEVTVGGLEALDRPIAGVAGRSQPRAEACHGLMMKRVDAGS